jgi:fumarylacetoacetate (FAA) hydrolase
MRLATVFDPESHEPRAVFELPSGHRVELRELFRADSDSLDELDEDALHDELPLYFTDVGKTVEFLDDVIDAARQWARERADEVDRHGGMQLDDTAGAATRVDLMPFLPPVPLVRAFREFDAFNERRDAPGFGFASATSLIGHGAAVHAPDDCDELDYGLQLAAVVGRGGRNVRAADAWKHVAGFTIVNAFVARDLERVEFASGLGRSKSRDFATAVGPYLVSLDSLRDRIDADERLHLTMRAVLNGEQVARVDASTMQFTWPRLIEHASRDAELCPGDVISSGTATGGCLLTRSGGTWLKPGDVVDMEIERLGTLRTPIVARPTRGPALATASTSGRATLAV